MILNTTEFLCVQDKNQFWKSLHELGGRMYWLEGLVMVDDPNYNYPDLNFGLSLMKQRFHGYLPEEWSYGEGADLFIIMNMEVIRLEDIYLRMSL